MLFQSVSTSLPHQQQSSGMQGPQLPINLWFCGRCDCDHSGRCGACRGSFGIPFLTKNFEALFHMLLTICLDLLFCEVSISPSGHVPFSLYILDMGL